MGDEHTIEAFVQWSDDAGLGKSANRARVAKALLMVAAGEDLAAKHVDQLAAQYRKRMVSPRDIMAAREIAEQMCRWWKERADGDAGADDAEDRGGAGVTDDVGGLPDDFSFSDDLLSQDPDDAVELPRARLGGDGGAEGEPEEDRGLIPEEFKRGITKQETVDIDSLPASHGFRAAVVASVKPKTSDAPPALTTSSAPPEAKEERVSRTPSDKPQREDDEDEDEEGSDKRLIALLVALVVVAGAAVAATQLL